MQTISPYWQRLEKKLKNRRERRKMTPQQRLHLKQKLWLGKLKHNGKPGWATI